MRKPALLYLVHRIPYPPDKGDRIRTYHILRFLHERADVDVACLADAPVSSDTSDALQACCRKLAVHRLRHFRWLRAFASVAAGRTASEGAFHSPALRSTVRAWAGATRYHAVLASASSLTPYLQLDELRDVPAVVDLIDVDSQKWLDYAAAHSGPRAWLYGLEGKRLRKLENSLPARTRAVTLVSEAEADLYRGFSNSAAVHAVTNGVDLDYFRDEREASSSELPCVFVGALDYYPNIDAACWFCRQVWPQIHSRLPACRFMLVGRQPAPAVRELAGIPGVDLIGEVSDVRPYLKKAAVVVAPLRIARGLQNKVLEALAMSKAVVAAPGALAALATEPGTHLLAASTPAEWRDAVLRLLDDEPLRRRLGRAGRQYVEQHHNWSRCLEPLTRLLRLDGPVPETNSEIRMSKSETNSKFEIITLQPQTERF